MLVGIRTSNTKKRLELIMKTAMKSAIRFLTLVGLFSAPHLASAYYDPGVQRWINRDTRGNDGGPNHYRPMLDSPLQCIDASGLLTAAVTGTPDPAQPGAILIPPDPGPKGPIGTPGHVPLIVGNGPVANPPPNPVKHKRCSEDEVGYTRNSSNDSETCPCSGTVVGCIKFERCEAVLTRVGTEPMPPTYYWVPHRKCAACPEGRYGNY
jgi:hypothetical protein